MMMVSWRGILTRHKAPPILQFICMVSLVHTLIIIEPPAPCFFLSVLTFTTWDGMALSTQVILLIEL